MFISQSSIKEVQYVFVPLTNALAFRGRETGGISEPSRCHGVRDCFSFACPIALSRLRGVLLSCSVPFVSSDSPTVRPSMKILELLEKRQISLELKGFFLANRGFPMKHVVDPLLGQVTSALQILRVILASARELDDCCALSYFQE